MPTLAIHLDRTVNDKLAYNPETQMVPILALASKELSKAFVDENKSSAEVSFADPLDITSHHHPILLHLVAQNLSESTGENIAPHQIHDFELSLYDTREFSPCLLFSFSLWTDPSMLDRLQNPPLLEVLSTSSSSLPAATISFRLIAQSKV